MKNLLYISKHHLGLYYLFSFPSYAFLQPNCGSDVKKKLIVELEIVPSLSPIRAIKENMNSNNITFIIVLLINLMNLKWIYNKLCIKISSHINMNTYWILQNWKYVSISYQTMNDQQIFSVSWVCIFPIVLIQHPSIVT